MLLLVLCSLFGESGLGFLFVCFLLVNVLVPGGALECLKQPNQQNQTKRPPSPQIQKYSGITGIF